MFTSLKSLNYIKFNCTLFYFDFMVIKCESLTFIINLALKVEPK